MALALGSSPWLSRTLLPDSRLVEIQRSGNRSFLGLFSLRQSSALILHVSTPTAQNLLPGVVGNTRE